MHRVLGRLLAGVCCAALCAVTLAEPTAGAGGAAGLAGGAGAAAGASARFDDLAGYGWAASSIGALARRGIVVGTAPGRFDPGGAVTRAQLAVLLTRIFHLKAPAPAPAFSDVKPDFWGYAGVEAAAAFMGAGGAVSFGPDAPVSRLDVAAALGRVEVAQGLARLAPASVWARFADGASVPADVSGYAGVAVQAGVFAGYPDGTFRPSGSLDRAELAVALDRLLGGLPTAPASTPTAPPAPSPSPPASAADGGGARPQVTSINPSSGPLTGGTLVQITGSGFTGATDVRFGLAEAAGFSVEDDTRIEALSPQVYGTQPVDVTVAGPGGQSATGAGDIFTFVDPAAQAQAGSAPPAVAAPSGGPAVQQVSPASGPAAGGNQVTISGTDFTPGAQVYFGTSPAPVAAQTGGTIVVTAPPGQGSVPVTVVSGYGTTVGAADGRYTYVSGPFVTGLSPGGGPAAGGTSVTITGYGLSGATEVDFGATPAAQVQVESDWLVTAVAPPGAGTVTVAVKTPSGQASGAQLQFTYANPAPPVVQGISPNTGPSTGGTVVTIEGSGFTGATSVQFGTAGASAMLVVSDSRIVATSPSGTGTVDVTVTTPGGTSSKVWADQFGYFGSAYDCTTVSGNVYCTLQS